MAFLSSASTRSRQKLCNSKFFRQFVKTQDIFRKLIGIYQMKHVFLQIYTDVRMFKMILTCVWIPHVTCFIHLINDMSTTMYVFFEKNRTGRSRCSLLI